MQTASDLSVDHIIEQVMIRNQAQHYDYTRKDQHQLTPHEHIWHFQLQEENLELKAKLKQFKIKIKRKEEQVLKHSYLMKEITQLKSQLQSILKQNAKLQKDLNQMRLKNSQVNEQIRISLDDSLRKSKSKRQCSCSQLNLHRSSLERKQYQKEKIVTITDSPVRQILRTTKDVSIYCQLSTTANPQSDLQKRKVHIQSLKQIIKNQQRLISSYQQEFNSKTHYNQTQQRKNTRPSTSRLFPLERPTSLKTLQPLFSAGSIVKIKRN